MENASIGRKMAILIRAQLTAWVVTALLLLLMALLLFKLELNESKVSLRMTAVYAAVLLLAGWRQEGGKKKNSSGGFSPGQFIFSYCFCPCQNLGAERDGFLSLILTGALCLGGGMLGGMISRAENRAWKIKRAPGKYRWIFKKRYDILKLFLCDAVEF